MIVVYIDSELRSLHIEIMNPTGEILYNVVTRNALQKSNMDIYFSGFYIIRIRKEHEVFNHKLIVY